MSFAFHFPRRFVHRWLLIYPILIVIANFILRSGLAITVVIVNPVVSVGFFLKGLLRKC
jgi:hypothetical protein